jgi:hypothetical protein
MHFWPRQKLFAALAALACWWRLGGDPAAIGRGDDYHGLNAGAPIWNGQLVFTPQ